MTKEHVIEQYKHFCFLADGNFSERDFDVELPAGTKDSGDDGFMRMGKMSPERRLLIQSDAKANKEAMETKKDKQGNLLYPYLLNEKPKSRPTKTEDKE